MNSVQKSISLTATITNRPEINATSLYSYKLIPSEHVKFDPNNRFPVECSTLFVTDNPRGYSEYALMVDIAGQGFLDDKKTKFLRFHSLGPDRQGQPLYGIYDEHFIEYTNSKSKFFLGDQNYRLSYLTEYTRYGRGAQIEHKFNHLTIGSFINFPMFYPDIKRELAAYTTYSLSDNLILNVGYLNKLKNSGETHNLMSFSGIGNIFRWAKLDFEYAGGTSRTKLKQAVKTEMTINYGRLSLFYNFTYAEKDFPGYFSDTRNILANLNFFLSRKINIGINYNQILQNMALDTLYGRAVSRNYKCTENGKLECTENGNNCAQLFCFQK